MASPSIPAPPPAPNAQNWLELPPELTTSIFQRVGAIDVFMNARKVCRTWRQLCSDPEMWRVVDLRYSGDLCVDDMRKVSRKVVEISDGQMVDLTIRFFADDELLTFIAHRSSQLKRLCLNGLSEMFKKLPLLEELHLHGIDVSNQAIEVAGQYCPQLKTFKLNILDYSGEGIGCDMDALAIAKKHAWSTPSATLWK